MVKIPLSFGVGLPRDHPPSPCCSSDRRKFQGHRRQRSVHARAICRSTRTHFRLSSSAVGWTANRRSILYLSSMPWSCMTSTVGMASDLDTYACLSFGLAQLQLMRISIQCGGTPIQFVRSFPSLLAITPRRIRADAAVKAAEISLPVAIIPPLILIPNRRATTVLSLHRCAWTSLSLIPVAVAPPLLPEQFDFAH